MPLIQMSKDLKLVRYKLVLPYKGLSIIDLDCIHLVRALSRVGSKSPGIVLETRNFWIFVRTVKTIKLGARYKLPEQTLRCLVVLLQYLHLIKQSRLNPAVVHFGP